MTAWTVSKYQLWEQCALKYALEHEPERVIARFPGWKLAKLPPREESPQMLRGTDVHDMLERYVKGRVIDADHPHYGILENWRAQLDALRGWIGNARTGGTEVLWQFDNEWYPLEPGRLSHNMAVWHRQKLDAWFITQDLRGILIDYKTGKQYPDKHADAMEVYTLGMFAMFEDLSHVTSQLWYVDQPQGKNNPLTKEFSRDEDAPRLAKKWERRAAKFLTDERFDYFAGVHCNWCPYNAKKGGPCTRGT